LLEPIYEQDFLDCSYGFRTGRSAHQALDYFRNQLMNCRGGWVLEVDIRKFFRQSGSWSSANLSPTSGARRCAAAPDRQMAEGGRDGGRERELPRGRSAAGRSGLTPVVERVPALRAGSLVRAGREATPASARFPHPLRG